MTSLGTREVLAEGERATFHGTPRAAIELLERALDSPDGLDPGARTRARLLLGQARSTAGLLGSAMAGLQAAMPEAGDLAAEVAAAVAAIHRQLDDHQAALDWDRRAAAVATPDDPWPALGLAADAIGLGDGELAARHLAEAEPAVDKAGHWRVRLRHDALTAQLDLLAGRTESAVTRAGALVTEAERLVAPATVAQVLLLEGAARAQLGDEFSVVVLGRAAALAGALEAAPVAWPAHALLAALQAGRGRNGAATAALLDAGTWVARIAADLPAEARARWLARPQLAAIAAMAAPEPTPMPRSGAGGGGGPEHTPMPGSGAGGA
jgi:hypothetical protein